MNMDYTLEIDGYEVIHRPNTSPMLRIDINKREFDKIIADIDTNNINTPYLIFLIDTIRDPDDSSVISKDKLLMNSYNVFKNMHYNPRAYEQSLHYRIYTTDLGKWNFLGNNINVRLHSKILMIKECYQDGTNKSLAFWKKQVENLMSQSRLINLTGFERDPVLPEQLELPDAPLDMDNLDSIMAKLDAAIKMANG